ncbi:MAG: RIP metalloprotease RseP [Deltaproteobacteria bacterium]|nr:RIP metalloprotease RseP [Deltaproteobacteria bacterium]
MTPVFSFLQSGLLGILWFAVLISVVVFVHEMGHLLVGKWLGVTPVRFSLGFGKKLWGFKHQGTEYQVSALPFGGYVKFAGDNPYEPVPPEHEGHGFLQAKPAVRAAIAFAGPGANFLLAFLIFLGFSMMPQQTRAAVVGTVKPGSVAFKAGLRAGDKIVSIDGKPVRMFGDLQELISSAAGKHLAVMVERRGAQVKVDVVPEQVEVKTILETVRRGRIGIASMARLAEVAPLSPDSLAAKAGLRVFDRVTQLDGTAITSYEQLLGAVAQRWEDRAATAVTIQGSRPVFGRPEDEKVKREDFRLTLTLPADRAIAGTPMAFEDVEQALGIASAEMNVYSVDPKGAAAAGGILRGDRIVAIDGKRVEWLDDVDTLRRAAGDKPMTVLVLRDGKEQALQVTQPLEEDRDDNGMCMTVPVLGAHFDGAIWSGEVPMVSIRYGFFEAVSVAGQGTVDAVRGTLLVIGRMITGDIPRRQVGGLLSIGDAAKQAAEQGWEAFLFTIAMISMNLGVMNLLPVPILDGFHIVSSAIEGVARRALSIRFREVTSMIGLAMLVSLMLFALTNDVRNKWVDPCGKPAASAKG